jgi:ferrous iron transport protein B
MKIALIGNPNSGKTSLFNLLTGSNQKIGNFPGVTIDKKHGSLNYKDLTAEVVDLPGIYSLDPDTAEQKLTKNYLSKSNPDLIVNIIDSTNLSRSLYMTLQLRAFNLPVVVLLNMSDEADKKDIEIDEIKLSQLLNMPVLKISTLKKEGLKALVETIIGIRDNGLVVTPSCASCKGCTTCSEASSLYKQIDLIMSLCVRYPGRKQGRDFTSAIDSVILSKIFGLPIFFLIMFLVFTISFSGPVIFLSDSIHYFLTNIFSNSLQGLLVSIHSPEMLIALVCSGVIPGISSVLSFLPQITMLFILLSILEDTGYMTRAAFVADKFLSFTGLSGSSFIPMVMGFGCSVPAMMSCRTLPSKKDRAITIMIIPFIACGARFPVIALFAGTFFKSNQGFYVFLMYILGIVVSLISALILSRTKFKNEESSFIMEIPPYRLPVFRNLLLFTWEKVRGFLIKAGTTLFVASVVIWLLSNYTITLAPVTNMKDSILALISNVIAPIFAPLGFGTWQASASIITGVGAKEMIVSTLSILYPVQSGGIAGSFGLASAVAFVTFSLLYLPCMSSIITMKRELKSFKLTGFALLFSFVAAYIVSLIIYYVTLGVLR